MGKGKITELRPSLERLSSVCLSPTTRPFLTQECPCWWFISLFFLHLFVCLLYVYVLVCRYLCVLTCAMVPCGGQETTSRILLPPWGTWDWTQVTRCGVRCAYPMSWPWMSPFPGGGARPQFTSVHGYRLSTLHQPLSAGGSLLLPVSQC